MSTKKEVQNSPLDMLKWGVVFLLVAAAIGGNWYFSAESVLYRVLALVGVSIVALFVAYQTSKGREYWVQLRESWREVRKVVWPTRQETLQTTMIVVAFVLLVALILWGLDSLISLAVRAIIG